MKVERGLVEEKVCEYAGGAEKNEGERQKERLSYPYCLYLVSM